MDIHKELARVIKKADKSMICYLHESWSCSSSLNPKAWELRELMV